MHGLKFDRIFLASNLKLTLSGIENQNNNNSNISIKNNDDIDLSKIFLIFLRNKKLISIIFLSLFSFNIILVSYKRIFKPIYSGEFTLLIKPPNITPSSNSGISSNVSRPQVSRILQGGTANDNPTLFSVLESPIVLNEISKKYNISVDKLAQMIDISLYKTDKKIKAKGIIDVKLEIDNIKKGKLLINDLKDTYINYSLKQKQESLKKALNFIDEQYEYLNKKLENARTKLSNFRIKYKIIDPIKQASKMTRDIDEEKLYISKMEVNKNILEKLKKDIDSSDISIKSFLQKINTTGDSFIEASSRELQNTNGYNIEVELSKAKGQFKPESRVIKNLEKKLDLIRPSIVNNQLKIIDSSMNLLGNEIKARKKSLLKKQLDFEKMPDLIKKYKYLESESKLLANNLNVLLKSQEKLRVEFSDKKVPWKVLYEPVFYDKPTNPNIPYEIIVGSMISLMIALITVYFKDKIDNFFHEIEDLPIINKEQVLAKLPYNSEFDSIKYDKNNIDDFNAIFNRNNLNLKDYEDAICFVISKIKKLKSDFKYNTFLISSFLNCEDISSQLYLIRLLSKAGNKVLIIDFNDQETDYNTFFKLKNKKGMINFFKDSGISSKDLIKDVPSLKNTSLISKGIDKLNNQNLFSYDIKKFIDKIKEDNNFDFIFLMDSNLYDSSRSLELQKTADGIILQIQFGVNKKLVVENLINVLIQNGCNLVGLVTKSKEPK